MGSRNTGCILSALKIADAAVKTVLPTAMVATTGYLCGHGIQISRDLDSSEIKDDIKDAFSHVSSAVSAFLLACCMYELVSALIREGKHLTLPQGIAVCSLGLLALGGVGYSMINFGVEHTTKSSSYAAGSSVFLFKLATALTENLATSNKETLYASLNGSMTWTSY